MISLLVFPQLQAEGYTPDVIAISNYSLWHEMTHVLSSAMASLLATFNRPTFLAETAYADNHWYDWTHNPCGPARKRRIRLPPRDSSIT